MRWGGRAGGTGATYWLSIAAAGCQGVQTRYSAVQSLLCGMQKWFAPHRTIVEAPNGSAELGRIDHF